MRRREKVLARFMPVQPDLGSRVTDIANFFSAFKVSRVGWPWLDCVDKDQRPYFFNPFERVGKWQVPEKPWQCFPGQEFQEVSILVDMENIMANTEPAFAQAAKLRVFRQLFDGVCAVFGLVFDVGEVMRASSGVPKLMTAFHLPWPAGIESMVGDALRYYTRTRLLRRACDMARPWP